jgi:hypothetical protein
MKTDEAGRRSWHDMLSSGATRQRVMMRSSSRLFRPEPHPPGLSHAFSAGAARGLSLAATISWRAPRAASTSTVGDLGRITAHAMGRGLWTLPQGARDSPVFGHASCQLGQRVPRARRCPRCCSSPPAPTTPAMGCISSKHQPGDRLQLHVGDLPLCGRGARPGASAR